jgi:hypothetical protein
MNAPQLVILIFIFSCAIGAGHNGLELAGHLKALRTSSLLIDKEARLGFMLRYTGIARLYIYIPYFIYLHSLVTSRTF